MEINIKRIGIQSRGTVGWLAESLQNGTLTIEEGTLKHTNHRGLWVMGDNICQFLAAFNQYNLDKIHGNFQCFEVCDDRLDRLGVWTDAAWKSLMAVAQKWCDECNAQLGSEKPIEIHMFSVPTVAG